MTVARVGLWGRTIGAVSIEEGHSHASFQYDPEFARSDIEVSPLVMPLSREVYGFPGLSEASFRGLPGLLADSLPDRFGNALIDAWLAARGRSAESFNVVERLCYVGTRGMGALEFEPVVGPKPRPAQPVDVDALVELASEILTRRRDFKASFAAAERRAALEEILRVGTSAGGARAKAIIAWNPETSEVRSGQTEAGSGFEYWLLKFDGVSGNKDKELEDPEGYGAIEYAYARMATAAGIEMSPCRLLEEHGRRHFMTKRFDRTDEGGKLHMQSLAALAHLDFNDAGAHSYEQAFQVIRRLDLGMAAIEKQFRRMAFNLVARNQDDHVKNIAFLMDKRGRWSLSPAFDVTYSFNPDGLWTARHQMSVNGKRDDFTRDDLRACAKTAGMKRGRADSIVGEILDAVRRWPGYAKAAGVDPDARRRIRRAHRLDL